MVPEPFDDGRVQCGAEDAVDPAGVVAQVPDDVLDQLDVLAPLAAPYEGPCLRHVPLHQSAALAGALPHAVGGAGQLRYRLSFAEFIMRKRESLGARRFVVR